MLRKLIGIIPVLLLLTLPGNCQTNGIISRCSAWGLVQGKSCNVICIRRLEINGRTYFFTVDPYSLLTGYIPSDSIFALPENWDMIRAIFRSTPYFRLLSEAESLDNDIQDAGYTRAYRQIDGIELTIDLCPSVLPLDRIVFTEILRGFSRGQKPVPVSVCVTGRWMQNHRNDLEWLDSLSGAGELGITWINHSFNHFTYNDVPLTENFLLAGGTDINSEVLENEKAMFMHKLSPSVFFRFPGLVSDHAAYEQILGLGLIPVGSDAWLAKGQKPGKGSIVLIHANGNEPAGVRDFIELLRKKEPELISGRWELYDLRESMVKSSVSFR
ncbi:MAG TPA: hypothetical protein VMT63_12770 [Bacteroidales bacterium]|nr:hypothetical protein [Bacteroidales bacterium]